MSWHAVGFLSSIQEGFKLNVYEEKLVIAVWTTLYEINRNFNISVLQNFVQETTVRTELGFTVIRLDFKFLVLVRGERKKVNNLA